MVPIYDEQCYTSRCGYRKAHRVGVIIKVIKMKKLICIAILSFGFFTMSQAQVLKYFVSNGSSNTWDWAIADAGPTPAQYELNILPGQTRSGSIGFFAFNVEWKAVDNNNCYIYNLDPAPIVATTLPTTCANVTVTYKIVETIPFVEYVYKAILN